MTEEIFVLPVSLEVAMLEHAHEGLLAEVGGFLVALAGKEAHRVAPIPNHHPVSTRHYVMSPAAVRRLQAGMEAAGEVLCAIYHCHPLAPEAVLSTRDIVRTEHLDLPHLVVAPHADGARRVRAWAVRQEQDRRSVQELPIQRSSPADDLETVRTLLSEDNVVALAYRSADGGERHLGRVRVVRCNIDSVVVLNERRHVAIGLDRIILVRLFSESAEAAGRRSFAERLLIQAATSMGAGRTGAARSAIEAACRSIPGLSPRMGRR